MSRGKFGPNRLGCYCEGDVTYWFSWWAHQDSNLGPTDYESLADNQPQLTTTACVTSFKLPLPLFYCHLSSLVVVGCVAVVQIWSKLIGLLGS